MATATREHLHVLIDRLPEGDISAAERFLEFLVTEPVSPDLGDSIRRGLADSAAGRTIDCATPGEMFAKLLSDDGK